MRTFRNHGITTEFRQRQQSGSWAYEMVDLGYNYRMTDFQCALGLSQLKKLPGWITRGNEIAATYDEAFSRMGIRSVGRQLFPAMMDEEVARVIQAVREWSGWNVEQKHAKVAKRSRESSGVDGIAGML